MKEAWIIPGSFVVYAGGGGPYPSSPCPFTPDRPPTRSVFQAQERVSEALCRLPLQLFADRRMGDVDERPCALG